MKLIVGLGNQTKNKSNPFLFRKLNRAKNISEDYSYHVV